MPTELRLTAPVVLPCDAACSVLRDAVVDVADDGRIAFVGERSTAPELPDDAARFDGSGLLLPGLINAHAHTPMIPLRGLGGDLPLERWLREAIWPNEAKLTDRDSHDAMVLGAIEMLRAGTTTSVEMFFFRDAVVEAVLAVGSRVVITPGIIDAPGWDRLGTWQHMLDDVRAWIDASGLRGGPGERVERGYGPHSAYTLPAEALAVVADAAQEHGALMHIHVAETLAEDAALRAEHGSVPLLLERLGALDGRVLAAHSVHLSDDDIAAYARHGVAVAHCPGSNAKLASGTARLVDLLAAGIAVGLGTDGPASNDDLDLWEEARLSALLARLSTGDAAALTAARALLLCTRDGAAAIGRSDLGVLEPGRWADVVHVGVDDPAFATGLDAPDSQLIANLVWAAGARHVRDVWVAGDQVVSDGEPVNVDRAAAQAAVGRIAARLRSTA